MADEPTITRRSFFRGLPLAAMAVSLPGLATQEALGARERVDFHIAELQKALTDLEMGPLEVRLQSDQGAVIDLLDEAPINRGLPRTLWRVQA